MTEHNENSAFVPVPETGIVVPTSDRIRELEAALAKAEGERDALLIQGNTVAAEIAADRDRLEAKLREALQTLYIFTAWPDYDEDDMARARAVVQSIEKELGS